jgi:hypothetical protein
MKLYSNISQLTVTEHNDNVARCLGVGGCISDCFLDNGVPNTGNRRIAAVPIQWKRQHTWQRNSRTRCSLSSPPRGYLSESTRRRELEGIQERLECAREDSS